jgi:[ribosomal protein S18]-alanine N-acetyltransferase
VTPQVLAALHGAAFTTPRPWRADEFAAFLADKACDLVALPGGFALIRTVADEAELLTIAVDPEQRRKGIATTLLTQCTTRTRARGAVTLFLEVAAANSAAIALYEKAGFARTGRRPHYYACPDGTRLDAIIMARDLQVSTAEIPESG